jgi:hypothetical protein
MVRSKLLGVALTSLLAPIAAAASLEAPRAFEAILPTVAAAAPGTYVVNGKELLPVPDDGRLTVRLQADVLKGPDRTARVGVVVGAEGAHPMEARLRVNRVAAAGAAAMLVADAGGNGPAGPLRLVRELSLPPGDYELEAVVGEARDGTGLVTIAKSRLSVPDVQSGALVVTPIVTGEAASAERPASLPFVFGRTVLTPAVSSRRRQEDAIDVAFRVYNWSAQAEQKPDLTVEYLFYEQGKKGLHFFNKVKPQDLNEATLGPAFVSSAGVVASGMRIPLAAFTFGDFNLVVRVRDNRSQQSAEQFLTFSVAP